MILKGAEFQVPRGSSRIPKAAVIDYGIGNLFSISCSLRKVGVDVDIVSASQRVRDVDAVVLPGVGNFKAGSQNLMAFRQNILGPVGNGVLLFGVCLGMQLLFEKSEESAGIGLGLLKGQVVRLPRQVKTPHMGWNTLRISKPSSFLEGVNEKDYFYFVHSYYGTPSESDIVIAKTDYGLSFPSVVAQDNIYGTQFHPEKSGKLGQRVLANLVAIIKR